MIQIRIILSEIDVAENKFDDDTDNFDEMLVTLKVGLILVSRLKLFPVVIYLLKVNNRNTRTKV